MTTKDTHISPGVLIAIWVGRGHDVEVVRVEESCGLAAAWGELVQDVQARGRWDPLPSVNATVNPDGFLAATWRDLFSVLR